MREPCCTVGLTSYEKQGHIPGGLIWTVTWLPKGFGPSMQDRLICTFFDTEGRWPTERFGLQMETRPPLIRAVCDAIEKHLREHPEDIAGHLVNVG